MAISYRLIFEYLEALYNTKRIHSHCDYMSPNDYEELYRRLQQDELQLQVKHEENLILTCTIILT